MYRVRLLLLLLIFSLPGVALGKDDFSDPRLTRWAAMTLEGKNAEVLRQVENDLVSSKPYFYSPYIWVQLHGESEYVQQAYGSLKDRRLRKVLAPWQEIFTSRTGKDSLKLLQRYPPATIKKLHPVLILNLMYVAINQENFGLALQYAEQMLRRGDDSFWFVWAAFNVFEDDERARTKVLGQLRSGGYLKDEATERFLLKILETRPFNNEVMIECTRDWLKTHPKDAFALQHLASDLDRTGKYEEAASEYEKALQIFPFKNRWQWHAESLLKVHRAVEADQVILRSVKLAGFKDLEQVVGLRRHQVLSMIDDDAAYILLEQLNLQWPDHEGLTTARADLEMKLGRYADALEYAQRLAARYPKKIEHQVRLLKALHRSHHTAEAMKLYESIKIAFGDIPGDLYEVAEELLDKAKMSKELEALRLKYARQHPDSLRQPELRADKLAAAGQLDGAIEKYRKLFKVSLPTSDQLKKYTALHRRRFGLVPAIKELDALVRSYPWNYHTAFLAPSPVAGSPVSPESVHKARNNALPQLVAQVGHKGGVNALTVSPDKSLLASAGTDGIVIIWHLESGKELRRLQHQQPVRAVCFAENGSTLVTGGDDGLLRLWNPATGALQKEYKALDGGILALALAPDGKALLVAGAAKSAVLLAFPDLKELAKLTGHEAGISSVAFAPDGRHVATASIDRTIRVWESSSGQKKVSLSGHRDAVTSLVFSADGRFLASGAADGTTRLWHLATGVELANIEMERPVQSLAPRSESVFAILVGLDGGETDLVDFDKGVIERRFPTQGGESRAIAPLQGDRFLVAGGDGVIRELQFAADGKERTLSGLTDTLSPTGVSPDGNYIVSATDKGFVRLWSLKANEGHFTIRATRENEPVTWSFSGDGRYLAVYSRSGVVVIHDMHKQEQKSRVTLQSPGLLQLLLSKDGTSMATLHEDGTTRLWDSESGRQKAKISRVLPLGTPLAFTTDGNRLLVGSEDSTVHILDSRTGAQLQKLGGHSGGIVSVALSSDGKKGAVSSLDSTVSIWDLIDYRQEWTLDKLNGVAVALSFKPETHTLFVALPRVPATVVDTDTKEIMPSLLGGRSADTDRLAFSGNGGHLLTGSAVYGERLWDLATGIEIASFKVDNQSVSKASFSPNEAFVAIPADGGIIRLIDVMTGKELLSLASFTDDTWAVVAPDGRFDTNNLEEIKGLHWVMPDVPFTPLPVEAFMSEYYEPRLLANLLSGKSNLRQIAPPASKNLIRPIVTIDKILPVAGDPTQVAVTVTAHQVTHNGKQSGLKDLCLFRDGQSVECVDNDLPLTDGSFTKTFNAHLPMAEAGQTEAVFTAYAFNMDSIKSATSQPVTINLPQGTPQRRAYIISIGVGAYANSKMDLRYAPVDAVSLNRDLARSLIATGRFAQGNIVPVLLTSNGTWDNGDERWQQITNNLAYREIIKGVLDLLAGKPDNVSARLRALIPNSDRLHKATPDDLVVITFSGHGRTHKNDFLFCTADEVPNEDKIDKNFITSGAMASWLRDIDAGEMALIIDACQSAAAVNDREFMPGPMGSRGLGQLAYSKGIRILAATQADNVAWDSEQLKHGVLTYTLLSEGLGTINSDRQVPTRTITMKQWLTTGVKQLPTIQARIKNNAIVAQRAKGAGPTSILMDEKPQQPALFDFRRQKKEIPLAVWK